MFHHDMHGLLNDLDVENQVEPHEANSNSAPEQDTLRSNFHDILKEAKEKVYQNSKYSKLSCIVHLYHMKCLNGWSNNSFSMLLEFLTDLLPEGNMLPKTTQQDKENDESCSTCGSSIWEVPEDNSNSETNPTKKKAAKILRWFPLKPRLQRLFISSKTTSLMKWHHVERVKDGKLRHHADGLAWKDFDRKFPEFASDPRNIRLALASDGFNPFRTMNTTYSTLGVSTVRYGAVLS
ncbi:hypothetical protein LXL04_037383 [Taraxacum kok-saghyz]